MNENSNGAVPAGYKPENDLAINSGGTDNEFYFDQASKRWVRRGQEQQAAVDYEKYDYNTGRLKQVRILCCYHFDFRILILYCGKLLLFPFYWNIILIAHMLVDL